MTDDQSACPPEGVHATVVIPVGKDRRWLPVQLEALANQTYGGRWEVVLAVNSPSQRLGEEIPVLPFSWRAVDATAKPGPAHARNRGAVAASGTVVAFCDSDDQVAPGWLEQHVQALAASDVSLGSLVLDTEFNSGTQRSWYHSLPLSPAVTREFLLSGPSANMAWRRSAFLELDGFDESFPTAGEDVDLCWRAILAGLRVAPLEDALVGYRLRSSLGDLWRQSFSWARSEVDLYRRYRSLGMRRTPITRVLRDLGWLVKHAPGLVTSTATRGEWIASVALRAGRAAGSYQYRVWYP